VPTTGFSHIALARWQDGDCLLAGNCHCDTIAGGCARTETTRARTLLGRDVGGVRDAPHVTLEATSHSLIGTPEGDELLLWDTPGFGDSARLARRLQQQGNPIGWFLAQLWDRFRDRVFWLLQQAVFNVREQADVVLYLVNASEEPTDVGYLSLELAVLEWIGKPVIVLLNQTGRPRPGDEDAAERERWHNALTVVVQTWI
jgi:predicted GTPase